MRRVFAVVCFVLLSHSVAYSEEALVPGTTGWILSYDRGDRGCFVYAVYKQSETVIGFMSDGSEVYFLLADEDWNIAENEGYGVRFRFDGRRWHRGTFASLSSTVMGMQLHPVGERELRRSRGVEVYGERGNLVGHYGLMGSSQAIDYVRKCGVIASGVEHNPFGPPTVNRSGAPTANPFR